MSKSKGSAGAMGALPVATVDGALDLLRAKGGRVTSSRRVMLEILFDAERHFTADELAAGVQARLPDVNISTIYRNLEALQDLGVIVHSHLGHGPATYELATMPHAHLICESCGRVVEAPEDLFTGLADDALARLDFAIDPRHFAIQGRCGACR